VTAGFVQLCDLSDGKFVPLRDFNDNRFSVTVGFVPLFYFTRFQRQSVLFRYEILIMSVLLGYEISETAGFVRLCDLNDGKFVPLRDFKDNWFCFVARFH